MKIDSHHHFWRYTVEDYGWIDDAMDDIRRDFLPEHLHLTIVKAGVDAVISVQARQTIEETTWLLELARQNKFIHGVVGWVPLVEADVSKHLEKFVANPKFKSVRHVVQGEPDPNFILREDFNHGIRALRPFDLAYDILIFEHQLPKTIAFVDRHPEQRFIVDHLAKPRVKAGVLSPWRENLRELARRPNVWCKLSGAVTEADYHAWTEESLQPYLETALEIFGADRLMFGSDWPVCLVACEYRRWVDLVGRFIARLSPDEQEKFWHTNARMAYRC
ncbi:MAG: amidohydrolase [Verrucomicrobia bacterium]|nr:MAG: amidohydrolase [Verrucomicrobiota bacterium]